ncbi:prepilin-type N-terminal cleavage/methylation domain-containing protein [Geminisphaera colitermitum]|uniref:prepilin-type N-terminal cleavage/methylation domain-containing protein n=1 Tax=Geminisphaera colitermitum TaxID=1148786 RepID=UPI0001965182|nr:prepilin-type N-terminal cleavage/methylation domain-containing protein [Geminisphaera colitermitum]
MKKRHNSRSTQSAAFTLIELLTVVAIIGILAGIILGTIDNVRKKAHQVRCISNLRQVGIAMHAYINDNKDKLPGPVYAKITNTYGKAENTALAWRLSTYLGYPDPATIPSSLHPFVPLLHCPSRGIADDTSICTFAAQCDLNKTKSPNNDNRAFGQPDGVDPKDETKGIRPLRYSELDILGGASRVWALAEVDQTVTYSYITGQSGWYNSLPKNPPHGNKHTILWFDGRVNLLAEWPARY